jgi:hypothetical protein
VIDWTDSKLIPTLDRLPGSVGTDIAHVWHIGKTDWAPKYGDHDFRGRYDRPCARLRHFSLRKAHSFKVSSREEPRLVTCQEVTPTLLPVPSKVLHEGLCDSHRGCLCHTAERAGEPTVNVWRQMTPFVDDPISRTEES